MSAVGTRDYLTGLYNRKGIAEKYEALPQGCPVHVLFCDLDNFKSVNDIYGHAAGDELLVEFVHLVQESAPQAIAGRLGGDEFLLIFSEEMEKSELAEIASDIMHRLDNRRKEMQVLTAVSACIGIVYNERSTSDLRTILSKSDSAMYRAKRLGKNGYFFYDELQEQILTERMMEGQSLEALENMRFRLKFLPVNNLQSSRLEQARVCLIWEREDGGIWGPEEFGPVLERTGFICKLDEYAVQQLCMQLAEIEKSGREYGKVGVRLSHLTYIEDGLADRLLAIMDKYGVKQENLFLGIDESAFAQRDAEQVMASLLRLKQRGFRLELLGFGASFASFRYLRELPVETIHFDPAYFKENLKTTRGQQILKTLIRLGKDLKQLMVADGVSEQEEIIFLMGCGCDAASGSYYSNELDMEEYLQFAKNRIPHGENRVAYEFQGNLLSTDGMYPGRMVGDGVIYTKGISDRWGGVHFPGGAVGENLISFPGQIFSGKSFTIAFWVKPEETCAWASVVYAQFMEGFVSVVPYASEGVSIFRICEDQDLNGWHDVLVHCPDAGKWTFVTVTYDAYSESTRYYFNARKAGYQLHVPMMYACSQVMLGGDAFQKAFTGTVSAFYVSDQAKTEDEIAQMYEKFLNEPGFCGQAPIKDVVEHERAEMLRGDIFGK